MDFFIKREPKAEMARYRQQALKAAAIGDERLAGYWRLASDEARFVHDQGQATAILQPQGASYLQEIARLSYSNQEGNYYLDHQLKKSKSLHWAFSRNETREAGSAYRYWIAFAQAQDSKNFDQEIDQTSRASILYFSTLPEVAHYAGQAASLFQKAQHIKLHDPQGDVFSHTLLIHRWRRAACKAAYLASIHLDRSRATFKKDPRLEHAWNALIEFIKEDLCLLIKAAEATHIGAEDEAIQYCLAACAVAHGVDAILETLTSPKDSLDEYIEHDTSLVREHQKVIKFRLATREALARDSRLAGFWSKAACSLENSLDASFYSLESHNKKPEYPLLSFYWEESAKTSKNVSVLFARCARLYNTYPFLPFLLLEKYARYLQKKTQKKIPIIFFEKVSFQIMESLLPTYGWRKKWEEGTPIHYDALSKSAMVTCWVYQTWSFLQKAGLDCTLSTELPSFLSTGIFITMSKLLTPSLRRSPKSYGLFLIDILADGTPHRAADLHLVENRKYARFLPYSIFVPHWPQPFLKKRDPSRGNRFENICFFGEIQNLAPELRSQEWSERLYKELGLRFLIREPRDWSDYSDIDCVVGIRSFSRASYLNKPATKLYNSWLAGVPFIGGSDSAFAADGDPGENYLVAKSLKELLTHLKELKENSCLRSQLAENGVQSAQAYTKEATLEFWKKLFEETIPLRAFFCQQRSPWQRMFIYLMQRVVCKLHHWYFHFFSLNEPAKQNEGNAYATHAQGILQSQIARSP